MPDSVPASSYTDLLRNTVSAGPGKTFKANAKIKKATRGLQKNPRLPEHIKIRKSVAAFALASCPQIIIAQGLGLPNIESKRNNFKGCRFTV